MRIKFNRDSSFYIKNVNEISNLYFPITNGQLFRGSITPNLNGDLKLDQNHFSLLPVSQEDLQNSLFGRHFWLNIFDYGLYNLSGVSAGQKYKQDDTVDLEAGFLYHTVHRYNNNLGLKTEITTFSPYGKENIELTRFTITNNGKKPLSFVPTVAIPLFSRSADNLRDHRHVTSLLNSSRIVQNGIINKPTLSFDERGHLKNNVSYGVFVSGDVIAYNPKLQEFIGEGGYLDWPKSLLKDKIGQYKIGDEVKGFEIIGALQLISMTLEVNDSISYVVAIGIDEEGGDFPNILRDYCNNERFTALFDSTKKMWTEKLSSLEISTGDENFDHWIKWTFLQPILRRIYGCSFLPHHDYGKGGRGWRDLWQDCLALLLTANNDVKNLLYNNFGGVRIDGSNATIIGNNPGEFIADRNNIVRVWMDHGIWPWNTTKLYLDQTGDYSFLFQKQAYFKDANISLGKKKDNKWDTSYGNKQLTDNNEIYEGTILEHILLQNLIQFYHVGKHNNILLDGADWNDGMDMAKDEGESVAFTAFYYLNLVQIADYLKYLKARGITTIEIFHELGILLNDNIDYDDIKAKKALLAEYFSMVEHSLSGKTINLIIDDVIISLQRKATFIREHLQKQEWMEIDDEMGFFNGYYDNHGKRLEGLTNNGIRMTLTGQVFPIMSKIATSKQVQMILNTAKKYLYNEDVAGYRLNTDFQELKLDMGRLFGFAYGHKENGAMFSHMAMMFVNALYKQGYSEEAYDIINLIYKHCLDFDTAKIYPGIPEYFDSDGRGMYHYLTGSASWLILNVVTELFGVSGNNGNLVVNPKLPLALFDDNNEAKITTIFANKPVNIVYKNINRKELNDYKVSKIIINKKEIIEKDINKAYLEENRINNIEVILD